MQNVSKNTLLFMFICLCVCIYVFITVFNRNRLTRVYNVRRQAHMHTRMHTRLTIQVAGELFTHTHTHALLFTFSRANQTNRTARSIGDNTVYRNRYLSLILAADCLLCFLFGKYGTCCTKLLFLMNFLHANETFFS